VTPADAAACAGALREAGERRASVRVRGQATKDYLGEVRPADETIDTRELAGIVDHVPADLTVTVRAGTRFAALQDALARAGQWLPLDPPHAADASVGGIIATNSSGFGHARHGAVRDLLIGTTTALADGTLARAGGRVVKNVAGYDLNKLLVGSLGTLGVIVEATFKVQPLPRARGASTLRFASAREAFARASEITHGVLRPSALAVASEGRGRWLLLVAAAGEPAEVDRTLRDVGGERADDPEPVLGPLRELPATARDGALVRAALPPAAQAAFAESALRLDAFARLVADAASGIVRVHLSGEDAVVLADADALLAAASAVGGTARVERRAPALAARLAAWAAHEPGGLFLMRRIKAAFDPEGALEPGRSIVG
jgi:glycolate oxidase FAD binding subunit